MNNEHENIKQVMSEILPHELPEVEKELRDIEGTIVLTEYYLKAYVEEIISVDETTVLFFLKEKDSQVLISKRGKWRGDYSIQINDKEYKLPQDRDKLKMIFYDMYLTTSSILELLMIAHDWSYEMTDDSSVWKSGRNSAKRIKRWCDKAKNEGISQETIDALLDKYSHGHSL